MKNGNLTCSCCGAILERENYPNYDFVDFRWIWLSSMITGMAPILYQTKGDKDALKLTYQFAQEYHDKVFATYSQTMHDLGFLYLPYGDIKKEYGKFSDDGKSYEILEKDTPHP